MLHFPAQTRGKSAGSLPFFYSSVGRWVGTLGPSEHIPLMLSLLDAENIHVIWHQMPLFIFTLVASFFKCPKARSWSVTKANQPAGHNAAHWDLIPRAADGTVQGMAQDGPGSVPACCSVNCTLTQVLLTVQDPILCFEHPLSVILFQWLWRSSDDSVSAETI